METIEIYNKELIINKTDKYNFIIDCVYHKGVKRTSKFYKILKNGEIILHTSLHQTWYKYMRKIEG